MAVDRKKPHKPRRETTAPRADDTTAGAPVRVKSSRARGRRAMSVALRLSSEEYQLFLWAASKSGARGVHSWMRARLMGAARAALPARVVEDILQGRPTGDLLRKSLEVRAARPSARVLRFSPRRPSNEP